MYYIRMVPRTEGVKKSRKPRRSVENYPSVEAAVRAMHNYVHEQEKLSMRQIGLVTFSTTEINDGLGVVLEIKPALTLMRGLELTFTVEAV